MTIVLPRVLTRILKIGVKMQSWNFTILFYSDFAKSWSQRQKVGAKYSRFGVNKNSDCINMKSNVFFTYMWILQRFNKERNSFLVSINLWLIITFRWVYCNLLYFFSISLQQHLIIIKPLHDKTYKIICTQQGHRSACTYIHVVCDKSLCEFVCLFEVLRLIQQLKSRRASHLHNNTIPG